MKQATATSHYPWLAAGLSIIPGLGQLYNRRWVKGVSLLLFTVLCGAIFADFINIGLWGIWTLGTLPGTDHSIWLLIKGIITVLSLLVFSVFVIFNMKDAWTDARRLREGARPLSLGERAAQTWHFGFPYMVVLPGLIILLFVVALPLLFMFAIAFTDYNLYNSPPRKLLHWVGFANFKALLNIPIWKNTFFDVFKWTVVWAFGASTLQVVLGMFLAVVVNDPRVKFKKLFRTILILPWAVPPFVSIMVFSALFHDDFGAINRSFVEPLLGISIPWETNVWGTRSALLLVNTWLSYSFLFAIFTGVLQSISADLYEAADIDGGNRWQKFRYVTLPQLLYAIGPILILIYAGNFNNFNLIYLFNKGGPPVLGAGAGGTDILLSWVYNMTFSTQNYNMAAAVSIIIGILTISMSFYHLRKLAAFKEDPRT
jgi:arabinogalactan oligomer/maltooligosaccharide transport system permease protein